MAWTLTEPVSGVSVTLHPEAGDIQVTEDQTTGVVYALRGASPYISDGPRRAATVTIPDCVFTETPAFEQLRLLRSLSRRMVLVDDTGASWPVRFHGALSWRVIDTPDRAAKPMRYVALPLVGVL